MAVITRPSPSVGSPSPLDNNKSRREEQQDRRAPDSVPSTSGTAKDASPSPPSPSPPSPSPPPSVRASSTSTARPASSDPLDLVSHQSSPEIEAGPSRRTATRIIGETSDDDEIVFLRDSRASTGKGKGKGRLVGVEIPLVPLKRLKRYYVLHGEGVTSSSRESLLQEQEGLASQDGSRGRRSGSGWKGSGSSDDFGGYASEEDEDEGSVVAWAPSEEEEEVVLRRSGRFGPIKRGGSDEGRPATRTRARDKKREATTRSSRPSTVSESSFYSHPQRSSNRTHGKKRRYTRSDDSSEGNDDMASSDDFVVQRDPLSDESDYDERKGKKRANGDKAKGKAKVDWDVLDSHRPFCEKCKREPADEILAKEIARQKRGAKRRKRDEDEIPEDELARQMGGWLECEKCCTSNHWNCIPVTLQKEVLVSLAEYEGPPSDPSKKRRAVAIDEDVTYTCARCAADPTCFVCHRDDLEEKPAGETMEVDGEDKEEVQPKFRCFRCKMACHYEHLEDPFAPDEPHELPDIASYYQQAWSGGDQWFCHRCREWVWPTDMVIAWRPLPADAIEPESSPDSPPSYKDELPREYLVKWKARGFRHATWVPHQWLRSLSPLLLKNFLEKGPQLDLVTDETLAARGDDMAEPTIANVLQEDDTVHGERGGAHHARGKEEDKWTGGGPPPDRNAEQSIPVAWSTVDRVLDVQLLPPPTKDKKGKTKRATRVLSVSSASSGPDDSTPRPDGIEPPLDVRVDIDAWEQRTKRELDDKDVDEIAPMVTWCLVKWDDLQYDQSTWDTPPPRDSPLYPAFKQALARYLRARRVDVPVLTRAEARERDKVVDDVYAPPDRQPECIVGGKLMPFQLEGLQWLLYKHFKRESCILADDMGLGKTIQIASLLGTLCSDEHRLYPHLVIVPNSTITNWVREFEKWVPHIRVVPYYGQAASRKIISKYELYHKGYQNKAEGLKAHVVLTTYENITGSEFRVFSGVPRWETICVDEGQRLKSDNSLIFSRLKLLNAAHRVLLTGTPLNNNLRELFNLLNFLDPAEFRNLEDLEKRFENLNETLVSELHKMISPYILRRIKADVLKLPPKVEIIVPISLSPLQKNVYKSILERNADVIEAIAAARKKRFKAAQKLNTNGTIDLTDRPIPAAKEPEVEAVAASST